MTTPKPIDMRAKLSSEIERTDITEAVIEFLKGYADKRVDARIEGKLQAELCKRFGQTDYQVHLTKSCGMTSLEWGGYSRSQGNQWRSLLLSHSTACEPIAAKYLADMDSLLAAMKERNEVRQRLLDSIYPEALTALTQQLISVKEMYEAIHDGDPDYWKVLPSFDRTMNDLFETRSR